MSLSELIAASPIAALICDPLEPDTPIIECNAAFVALTGYSREEVLGRNCRFMRGSGTEPDLTQQIRAAIADRRPILVEILNYKKDASPFRNAVLIAPIFDESGTLQYYLGSLMEVDDPALGSRRGAQARTRVSALTRRQQQVLIQMAAGQLNKQIAHSLGLSERTVKMHKAALQKALGVTTSADAIRIAVEAGY
ncbi:MAG: PAS domain-containing protein [Pseudomonadota bacterium]|nr:histidine kinase [Sphingobium sp.]MCC4252922.1 LuxR C-terminal-related transcriptional regulator [Sphingobium naphthae]MEC8035861.1 PAS domain-containing protein [Pseudomonadota bacterium]|tara:strand:+ start:1345 stop:1929 length:585 start_codon:yes stop_codon:yes gene_type:complete